MESQGITADGMSFSHRTSEPDVTPKVWTELGEAVSITPPQPSRSSVDFTHLKSPNKTREHKPSMIEPGEANVVLNYTKETRVKIGALFGLDAVQEFQVGYPDGSTETFSGFLTGMPTEGGEVEGKLTLNCPIKVTGLPVFVAGV